LPCAARRTRDAVSNKSITIAKVENGEVAPNALELLSRLYSTDEGGITLMLGDFGSGKTSLLLRAAYDALPGEKELKAHLAKRATKAKSGANGLLLFPFFLRLSEVERVTQPNGDTRFGPIINTISSFCKKRSLNVTSEQVTWLLNHERFKVVLFLDGLDEMVDRIDARQLNEAARCINDVLVTPGIHAFVSARQSFFISPLQIDAVKHRHRVDLTKFEKPLIVSYVNQYFSKSAEVRGKVLEALNDAQMLELCEKPLHLNMLCQVVARRAVRGSAGVVSRIDQLDLYADFIAGLHQRTLTDGPKTGDLAAAICNPRQSKGREKSLMPAPF